MLALTEMIKVKILPDQLKDKEYIQNSDEAGQGGKEYLVIGADDTRFIIVSDIGTFEYVSIHNTRFAGLVKEEPKLANISQIETEVTLSNGVKAEITKQINARLKDVKSAK